jgi:hypothetical protein
VRHGPAIGFGGAAPPDPGAAAVPSAIRRPLTLALATLAARIALGIPAAAAPIPPTFAHPSPHLDGPCGDPAQTTAVAPQAPSTPTPGDSLGARPALHVLDPYLDARLRAIAARSPRFAAALSRLAAGDVPVFIGTPAQLAGLRLAPGVAGGRLPPERVAEVRVALEPGSDRPAVLLVRVDTDRLGRLVRRPLLDWPLLGGTARFRARLARFTEATLVHEVWGHLVPVADARSAAASCADPAPGEPEMDSCVMKRENDLRAEIGWERRKGYRLL